MSCAHHQTATPRPSPTTGPGGIKPLFTRSTCVPSPTPTVTAWVTWRVCAAGWVYLELLGVDGLWLTPFFRSPMVDHGYDVSDPRDVDPLFGDLDAFDRCRRRPRPRIAGDHRPGAQSHLRAARVVPGGPVAAPGSPERDRYIFRAGRAGRFGAAEQLDQHLRRPGVDRPAPTENPDDPENSGDPRTPARLGRPRTLASRSRPRARSTRASGTCTCSHAEQPDLNWENPDVWPIWSDPAVLAGPRCGRLPHRRRARDGQTTGVARHATAIDLRRASPIPTSPIPASMPTSVHDIHRMVRKVLDEYPRHGWRSGRCGCATTTRFGRYVRPDELHLGFNFRLLRQRNSTPTRCATADRALAGGGRRRSARRPPGPCPTTTWSRPVTRYGDGERGPVPRPRDGAGTCWPCPARCTCTTVRSWACPTSTSPTGRCRTRCGSAPGRTVARPRRLPGAAAVGGRASRVRVHHRHPWLPIPSEWVTERGRAAREPRFDAVAVPAGAGTAPRAPGVRRGRRRVVRRTAGLFRLPPERSDAGLCAELLRARSRCRPATCCWPAARSSTACSPPTPPSGSRDAVPGCQESHVQVTRCQESGFPDNPAPPQTGSRGSDVTRRRTTAP